MTGKNRIVTTFIAAVVLCAVYLGAAPDAFAAGTTAGTTISNVATVNFAMGGSNYLANSNVHTLRVAEVITGAVTWLDTPPGVTVTPGQMGRFLTFQLTNAGNGNDRYALAATGAGIGGDQFDPAVTAVYLDNGNNVFDPATDMLYTSATNTLAPDAFVTVFVLSTVPSATVYDGDVGSVSLTARSLTGTGSPGTTFVGRGDTGTDAVLGATGGVQSATGAYVALSAVVNLAKTVAIIDQSGGSLPVPGATLRYTITVTAAGSTTANSVVISDPLPPDTTYRAGTLRLNGTLLTDGVDTDAGDVGGTNANIVTVRIGDLMAASPAQMVTFEVNIN